MDLTSQGFDHVVFFDEEYLLSLDVYKVVVQGLNAIMEFENTTSVKALGVGLAARSPQHAYMKDTSAFNLAPFTSGPITMSREIYALIRDHAEDYCHIDEYNWDWSLVHVAGLGHVPHTMIFPGVPRAKLIKERPDGLADTFEARDICVRNVPPVRHDKGFGGWGHPRRPEALHGSMAEQSRNSDGSQGIAFSSILVLCAHHLKGLLLGESYVLV